MEPGSTKDAHHESEFSPDRTCYGSFLNNIQRTLQHNGEPPGSEIKGGRSSFVQKLVSNDIAALITAALLPVPQAGRGPCSQTPSSSIASVIEALKADSGSLAGLSCLDHLSQECPQSI